MSQTFFAPFLLKKNINYLIHSLFFAQYIKKYISQAALHILIKDPFSPLSVSLGPFYGGWRGYWFTTCQHVTRQNLLANKKCLYIYSQDLVSILQIISCCPVDGQQGRSKPRQSSCRHAEREISKGAWFLGRGGTVEEQAVITSYMLNQ